MSSASSDASESLSLHLNPPKMKSCWPKHIAEQLSSLGMMRLIGTLEWGGDHFLLNAEAWKMIQHVDI